MSELVTAACEHCNASFERADLVYCPAGELLCPTCLNHHACRGTALSKATERRQFRRVLVTSLGFAAGGSGALVVAGVQVWIASFAVGAVLFAVGAITWGATVHQRIPFYPVGVRSSLFLATVGLALICVPAMLNDCSATGGSRPLPSVRTP
jgi:hypothetical protein